MIHLKQPLVLSAQSGNVASPLFATAAAASSQQRRASKAGGRVRTRRISCVSTEEATGATTSVKTKERNLTVTAIVTAQAAPASMYVSRGLDDIQDLFGKTLLLELVSSELDPKTGREREKVKGFAHMTLTQGTYEAKMSVPASFGPVGAVLVENEHHREMFLKDIKLITGGDESTATTFHIDSWVHSKFDNPEPRVFFSVRSYLPSQTPPGIEALRKKELETLRGDGQGERKFHDKTGAATNTKAGQDGGSLGGSGKTTRAAAPGSRSAPSLGAIPDQYGSNLAGNIPGLSLSCRFEALADLDQTEPGDGAPTPLDTSLPGLEESLASGETVSHVTDPVDAWLLDSPTGQAPGDALGSKPPISEPDLRGEVIAAISLSQGKRTKVVEVQASPRTTKKTTAASAVRKSSRNQGPAANRPVMERAKMLTKAKNLDPPSSGPALEGSGQTDGPGTGGHGGGRRPEALLAD